MTGELSLLDWMVLLAISAMLALNMDSVAGAWKFLLAFATGAGPVWIIRWYWWRINAWSDRLQFWSWLVIVALTPTTDSTAKPCSLIHWFSWQVFFSTDHRRYKRPLTTGLGAYHRNNVYQYEQPKNISSINMQGSKR